MLFVLSTKYLLLKTAFNDHIDLIDSKWWHMSRVICDVAILTSLNINHYKWVNSKVWMKELTSFTINFTIYLFSCNLLISPLGVEVIWFIRKTKASSVINNLFLSVLWSNISMLYAFSEFIFTPKCCAFGVKLSHLTNHSVHDWEIILIDNSYN